MQSCLTVIPKLHRRRGHVVPIVTNRASSAFNVANGCNTGCQLIISQSSEGGQNSVSPHLCVDAMGHRNEAPRIGFCAAGHHACRLACSQDADEPAACAPSVKRKSSTSCMMQSGQDPRLSWISEQCKVNQLTHQTLKCPHVQPQHSALSVQMLLNRH